MASILTVSVCAILFVGAALRRFGWVVALIGMVMVSLGLFPVSTGRGIFGFDVMYVVVILVGAIAILSLQSKLLPVSFVALLFFLIFGLSVAWGFSEEHVRSALSVLGAGFAWAAGAFLGKKAHGRLDVQKSLAVLIFLIVIFEAIVCVLQTFGVQIFMTSGRTADLTSGRANGTFSHPSVVGKVIVILTMILLPLSRVSERSTRKIALFAIVVSYIPILLSASRANIAAAILVAVLWALLSPRDQPLRARLLVPAAALVVTLTFLDEILARFALDPEGESRQHFLQVAFRQVRETPLIGVGPSSYVEVVGKFDWLTAQGWPVHNTFVLQIVELGIIGAVLFFAPLAIQFSRAATKLRDAGHTGDIARAIFVCTLAVGGPIANTGWGLLTDHVLYLWFFVTAFSASQLVASAGLGNAANVPLSRPVKLARSGVRR